MADRYTSNEENLFNIPAKTWQRYWVALHSEHEPTRRDANMFWHGVAMSVSWDSEENEEVTMLGNISQRLYYNLEEQ